MGICNSCEATAIIISSTAKLVLVDGRLQEFDRAVKVSQVLQKEPTSFVCNSDDMEYNGFVTALDENEELRLGQLYFLLPLSMLRNPLHGDEMAALAVKASNALMKCACRCTGVSLMNDYAAAGAELRNNITNANSHSVNASKPRQRSSSRSGGGRSTVRGRDFKSDLVPIAE